jgi:hypothetical protein
MKRDYLAEVNVTHEESEKCVQNFGPEIETSV